MEPPGEDAYTGQTQSRDMAASRGEDAHGR
jgi:hypothetical protein